MHLPYESKEWEVQAIVNDRVVLRKKQRQEATGTVFREDSKNYTFQNEYCNYHLRQKNVMSIKLPGGKIILTEFGPILGNQSKIYHLNQDSIISYAKNSSTFSHYQSLRYESPAEERDSQSSHKLNSNHFLSTSNPFKTKQQLANQIKQKNRSLIISDQNKQKHKTKQKQNYKNWFLSYNQKSEEFSKLIQRYLKGDANKKIKFQDQKSRKKVSNATDDWIPGMIQQIQQKIKLEDLPLNTEKSQQNCFQPFAQNYKNYMPKQSCLKFILDLEYLGLINHENCFLVTLQDETQAFITEDDLVQYFPHAYTRFIVKNIDQNLQQCIEHLQKLDTEKSENNQIFEHLASEVGIDIPALNFSFGLDRKKLTDQFFELRDFFNSNQNQDESTEKVNIDFNNSQDEIPIQLEGRLQNLQKIFSDQINRYFQDLELSSRSKPLQFEQIEKQHQFTFQKRKLSSIFGSISCQVLFKAVPFPEHLKQQRNLRTESKRQDFICIQTSKLEESNPDHPKQNFKFQGQKSKSEGKIFKPKIKQQQQADIGQIQKEFKKQSKVEEKNLTPLKKSQQEDAWMEDLLLPEEYSKQENELYDSDDDDNRK